jgi:prepilin-type N-terminal cleavage/methylation domain-containing protein
MMRRAFTLIELMVVVAVIGLLVAVLMPAMGNARAQARRAACANNLRQIGVGMQIYISGNHDRFPYASFMPSFGPFPLDREKPIRIVDVLKFNVPLESFECPSDSSGDGRPDPNAGLTYFQSEGSSYEYRTMPRIGGRTAKEIATLLSDRVDTTVADNSFYIMRDYDNFHGKGGKPGARRYLYSDGHVTDFEN